MTHKEILEVLESVMSYSEIHGKDGQWTYDMLCEGLKQAYDYLESIKYYHQ